MRMAKNFTFMSTELSKLISSDVAYYLQRVLRIYVLVFRIVLRRWKETKQQQACCLAQLLLAAA